MTNTRLEILSMLDDISENEAVTSKGEIVKLNTLSNVLTLYSSLNMFLNMNPKSNYSYASFRNDLRSKIELAYREDDLLTLKLLFYMRDIRGGQGLRDAFRVGMKHILFLSEKENNIHMLLPYLNLVGHYGRYDDLVFFMGHSDIVDDYIVNRIIKPTLSNDLEIAKKVLFEMETNQLDLESAVGKTVGESDLELTLLAKWLPSVNASSKKTQYEGRNIARKLGLSKKEYQKTLVEIRKVLNLVETKLSEKKFEEIDYSKVPSKAMKKYQKAFAKRDSEGYQGYLQSLVRQLANPNEVVAEEDKVKVNTKTLLPHEIVDKQLLNQITDRFYLGKVSEKLEKHRKEVISQFAENQKDKYDLSVSQWISYVNELEEKFGDIQSFIPILDTSGSMTYQLSSIGTSVFDLGVILTTMVSQINKGSWKDKVLTFSSTSKFVDIADTNNVYERILSLIEQRVPSLSTDFASSLSEVLNYAVENKIPKEEMPKALLCFTDMEFNSYSYSDFIRGYGNPQDFINGFKEMYEKHGYELPQIIVWNLTNDRTSMNVQGFEEGITTVSGFSIKNLNDILSSKIETPMKSMLRVLNSEKYQLVEDVYYR